MRNEIFRYLLAALVLGCVLYSLQAQTKSLAGLLIHREDDAITNDPNDYAGPVGRIYYINLAKNIQRRTLMEKWLKEQPIPYQRIEALVGAVNDTCPKGAEPARCRGMAGLSKTNLDIIRNHDTSGFTLVFEDDFYVQKDLLQAVQATLQVVPEDWDIIRWDCVGPIRSSFPMIINTTAMTVFRAAHLLPCQEPTCTFCGSTHAMLWRNTSLPKIEVIWAKQPYNDIDCRLVTNEINGYCVNMNLGLNRAPSGESSDITYIPKAKGPSTTR
jgi:hypothetical protein